MRPYESPDADVRLAVLGEIASELGVTPNQLVLARLLRQASPTIVPLIGPGQSSNTTPPCRRSM